MNIDIRDLQKIHRMLVIHADNDEAGAVAEEIMEEMQLTMEQYQEYIDWVRSDSEELLKMIEAENDNRE